MEVPRKFGVGKQQVSCPCTLPAAILAVGGWSGLQGVCRAPEDQTKSCRRQRGIFMRIRPFSQLRCIQTGRLLSVGEQRERAPSRVGTGGRPHDPAMSDNIKDKALMC